MADTIIQQLVDYVSKHIHETAIADIRIGLNYTAVLLENDNLGVAYTFKEQFGGGCSLFNSLRPLTRQPTERIVALAHASDPIEAGVGLACINALINSIYADDFLYGDVLQHLPMQATDTVGMIGHFGPLVETIKRQVATLTIFERIEKATDILRPQQEAYDILPTCDVAIISGTTIINHTIDSLLQSCKNCREVAILGASTPLVPDIFKHYNVSLLSGIVPKTPKKMLQIISEGGGMHYFGPYIQKVSLRNF